MAKARSINGTIPQSKYVPRQMNGPVINAYGAAQEAESRESDFITAYLHDLNLDNAQETELENLGRIIGYPRPIVPEGFNQENIFLFTTMPIIQSPDIGFSDIGGPGGLLSSTEESPDGMKLALGSYRRVLKVIARVKRYGVTIKNIDDIASEFDPNYTLSWESNGDIKIRYEKSIGYKNVWLLTQIFYRVCTAPQITIESGGL